MGQSEATYRALFENSNDAILLLRTDGTILSVNSRCVDILQYSVQEMLDRNSQDFIAPAELQDADERWERVLAGEAIPIYERKLLRKDGTLVDCDINLSLVRDEAGQPKLVQSLFRDITARKQAENVLRESEAKLRQSEAELRQANMVLEKAARLKDEFLATMSHELRTPLNSILGLSEVLAEQITGPLNERQLRSVRTIETSGRHLLTLINDILDLSKIEAGALVLNHAPIMVRDFCDNCLVFIKETAHKKKIKLSSTIDFHVMWIDGDERRLKQVFVNLLSNAVKFTAEGGRVDFQVQGDPEGGIVRFSVRDTGIGISAQDMPRLFRPFVQLDSGLTRRFEGTGLGLALVARMVELHGGSVSVESEPGQGSCFTITLPWTQEMQHLDFNTLAADSAPAKQNAGDIATDASAPLIMIVEDNDANRDTLAVYLRAKGYNVTTAKNGAQAIDAANRDLPALVLMDVQMPIMDGLEAIRRLRASTQTQIANVPIIALTAFAMPGDRERALQAGANAYMSKPVNLKELVQAVQALLEYKDAAAATTAD